MYLDSGCSVIIGSFDEVRQKIPNFDTQARLMGL
jgi:hypothetical protein